MIKKYLPFLFLFINLCLPGILRQGLYAQEAQIFTRSDFYLRGPVKSCLVITKYGKEEFEFNKDGILTKNLTRFNEQDYNVTYYKYSDGFLVEKRDEVYRDGTFDKQTSIAHFYAIDTTANKVIIEDVISYAGETLERYEYHYGEDQKIQQIIRSNNEGVDETQISYTEYKGEITEEYSLNGVIQKTIRTSYKENDKLKVVLTKQFLNGDPNKAKEKVFDKEDKLISLKEYIFDIYKNSFALEKTSRFSYDDAGMLAKEDINEGKTVKSLEYIYQYDKETDGNWVKQIISPENLFKTRRIKYYKPEEVNANKS